jgi:hypothetical protein
LTNSRELPTGGFHESLFGVSGNRQLNIVKLIIFAAYFYFELMIKKYLIMLYEKWRMEPPEVAYNHWLCHTKLRSQ